MGSMGLHWEGAADGTLRKSVAEAGSELNAFAVHCPMFSIPAALNIELYILQYSLLVFTVFEVLEGPIHGGDRLKTPKCN
jgi:hypothetical protein